MTVPRPISLAMSVFVMTLAATSAVHAGGPPANDDCADALPIALDTVIALDTTNATTDGPPATGCFFNNDFINKDIWYMFFAPQTREYRVSMCGSAYDSRLAVYDECDCPPLDPPIACDDDFCDPGLQSEVDFDAIEGWCYRIRVGGYVSSGGTTQSGTGIIEITEAPPPPVNDLCVDAISIDVPSTTFGTTTDATEDEEFTGCDTGFITYNGVWYKLIGTGTSITASTCSSGFDTKITVFCGGCAEDICVGGNDDYNCTAPPPIELQSRVVFCSRLGEEYLILVHGGLGDFGDFQLDVTANVNPCSFPAPCEFPPNDNCADAIDVTDGQTEFDTRLATTDGPDHDLCDVAQPTIHDDLWFRYTASCTGLATVSICDTGFGLGFDTRLAIYDGFGCVNLDDHILNCNDDYDCDGNGPDINDRHSQITIPVACGFEYLVRVGGDNLGDAGGGILTITCNGDPCVDPCPADIMPPGGDGQVSIADVNSVISAYGLPCKGCPQDIAPPRRRQPGHHR